MKTACMVNFVKNVHGLWETKYSAECSVLQRYLTENKVSCYVYSEKDITSVVDMAENIVAFSDEINIFMTNNENLYLNLSLAKQVQQEEEDCAIIFCIVEMLTEKNKDALNEEYHNVYFSSQLLGQTLGLEEHSEEILSKMLCQFVDENDVARFNGTPEILLGSKNQDGIISRNHKAVLKDIETVCKFNQKYDYLKLSGIPIDEFIEKETLIQAIQECGEQVTFLVHVNFDYILQQKVNIPDNAVISIIIKKIEQVETYKQVIERYKDRIFSLEISSSLLMENKQQLKAFLEYISEQNIQVKILYENDDYWKELKVEEIRPDLFSKRLDSEFQTLMNGFIFSYTGEYISVPLNGFVKHVKISNQEMSEEFLEFLDEVCSVNSSIFVEGLELIENSDFIHMDNMTKIYKKDQWIEDNKEINKSGSYFPKNLITCGKNSVNINGIQNDLLINLIEIPYSKYKLEKNGTPNLSDVMVLTLEEKEDFNCFIHEVEEFYKTKTIMHSSLLHTRLKNVCRFLSRNYCSMTKIPRIEITNDGNVHPCYEKTETIGTIADTLFDITQSAYVKHENIMRENKCSKCPVNIGCPKCAVMPEHIKEIYCDTMVNKPYVSDFILESIVMTRMAYTNKQVSALSLDNVKFSNEYMFNLLDGYPDGEEVPFFCKYVFIIEAAPFFAIWSPNSNKTFRISKEIAMVGEALLKKLHPLDIVALMEKETGMSNQDTAEFCKKAFELFYNNGLLHRPVQI